MSLEMVLLMIIIAPFVIGVLAALGGGSMTTPIVIDNRTIVVNEEVATSSEIEDQEEKLEESTTALSILEEIKVEEPLVHATQDAYQASGIPEMLNQSLKELFAEIDGNSINEQQQEDADSALLYDIDSYTPPSPLTDKEKNILQYKYGADVVNKITTTPGNGGTGDGYDCMIGRVIIDENATLLQYGDHYIPIKGMEFTNGAVYLVEGMFVKPDLFFVNNYKELEAAANINRAAEY